VLHTFGYPEPEIFGFLYVHPDRVASLGIFVPSWFDSPARTAYRYLQHWMLHPYLWRYLKGGKLRSWGAKTLGESGRRGEPHLTGDGYARIGEAAARLTCSPAPVWTKPGPPARNSLKPCWNCSRPKNRSPGKTSMKPTSNGAAQAGWKPKAASPRNPRRFSKRASPPHDRHGACRFDEWETVARQRADPAVETHPNGGRLFCRKNFREEIAKLRDECKTKNVSLHGALMDKVGWPAIPFDGQLLVSHQDALLMGGKVQAPAATQTTLFFSIPNFAKIAARGFALRRAAARRLLPAKPACRISTARNASTAARACGTAHRRNPENPNA